eukprot:gene37034-44942_t
MVEAVVGKYKGSAGMTTVNMEVFADGTANISVSMMFMTVLNATSIPFVLNQTSMIMEMEGAKLQPSLDDMMKIPMVTSTYGVVAPEGVQATYQPNGRDGNGQPAIWMTVHSTTGNKILSVTAPLQ